MLRVTAVMAVTGSVSATVRWGWRAGLGFLLGSALSYGNFRLWIRMVRGMGESGSTPRGAAFLGLRYLFVGAAVYAIINLSEVSLPAVLAGLLIAAAAVIAEIVYELIFLRS